MSNWFGFVALAISLIGHAMAAHGSRHGWVIRLVAAPLWMTTAITAGHAAYIVTSCCYTSLDLYACWKRFKKE